MRSRRVRRRAARRRGAVGVDRQRLHGLHGQVVGCRQPRAVLEFRGGVDHAPAPPGHLEPDRAERGLDADDLPRQALAVHLAVPQANRRRLARRRCRVSAGRRRRRRDHRQQRAGTVLLHLHRHVEHLERAGRVQAIHDDAEQLGVHVVDLAFDDHDAIGRRAVRRLAHEHAQHVRRRRKVARAGAVPHPLDRHRRDRRRRSRRTPTR